MDTEFCDGPADGEVLDLGEDTDLYFFELKSPTLTIRYHYQRNWAGKMVYRCPEMIFPVQ